jgi:hypothetical protein
MIYTPVKVETLKKGTLIKRTATAKKCYLRGEFNRSAGKYLLTDYDDISGFIYAKKGTLVYTDWITQETEV